MDYISLNVTWIIVNGVLEVLYRTILVNILGSSQLTKLGNTALPFLKTLDKLTAKRILASLIFVIFSVITIKKYNREKEEAMDTFGLIITILLGIAQLYFMWNVQLF